MNRLGLTHSDTSAEPDFAHYLDARWSDLIGGLEDEGVAPDVARLAVAETLLASRGSWRRRVESEQVDRTLWAEIRERAGLPPRPGALAPHAVRPRDVADLPGPWLEEAEVLRRARRRRGVRLGLLAAVVAVVAGTGWVWWASLPPAPAVREEANVLPVPWYTAGELHLSDVVVEVAGIETFVADGDDVVALLTSGEVKVVRADGDVDDLETAPSELSAPSPAIPAGLVGGQYDVVVQSVATADGGTAHLLDSARRTDQGGALRLSETGRRAVVVCDADGSCAEPQTIVTGSQTIRLG